MPIVVTVQNGKTMQSYAKLKKAIQHEGIARKYREKRYFTTDQQKKQAKVSMRVMREKALKNAQERNVSSSI